MSARQQKAKVAELPSRERTLMGEAHHPFLEEGQHCRRGDGATQQCSQADSAGWIEGGGVLVVTSSCWCWPSTRCNRHFCLKCTASRTFEMSIKPSILSARQYKNDLQPLRGAAYMDCTRMERTRVERPCVERRRTCPAHSTLSLPLPVGKLLLPFRFSTT